MDESSELLDSVPSSSLYQREALSSISTQSSWYSCFAFIVALITRQQSKEDAEREIVETLDVVREDLHKKDKEIARLRSEINDAEANLLALASYAFEGPNIPVDVQQRRIMLRNVVSTNQREIKQIQSGQGMWRSIYDIYGKDVEQQRLETVTLKLEKSFQRAGRSRNQMASRRSKVIDALETRKEMQNASHVQDEALLRSNDVDIEHIHFDPTQPTEAEKRFHTQTTIDRLQYDNNRLLAMNHDEFDEELNRIDEAPSSHPIRDPIINTLAKLDP